MLFYTFIVILVINEQLVGRIFEPGFECCCFVQNNVYLQNLVLNVQCLSKTISDGLKYVMYFI